MFEISRLLAGPFIRQVMNDIQHIISNRTNEYKGKFYSGVNKE